MGFGVTELIIILIIVDLLFGTKKLRNMGGDLGKAVKSFRSAIKDADNQDKIDDSSQPENGNIIEGEVEQQKEEAEKG